MSEFQESHASNFTGMVHGEWHDSFVFTFRVSMLHSDVMARFKALFQFKGSPSVTPEY